MPDRANVAATFHRRQVDDARFGYTQGDGRWGTNSVEWWECEGVRAPFAVGDRDCSSSVIDCWREALRGSAYEGALDSATYTGDMRAVFVGSGLFEWRPMGDGYVAQRGDVYLNEANHTAMCQSAVPDMLSEFLSNEHGGIVGGQAGDQTGGESLMRAYYDYPWDGILRYVGPGSAAPPDAPAWTPPVQARPLPDVRYRVATQAGGLLPEMVNHADTSDSGDGFAGDGSPIVYLGIDMPGWYQVRTASGWLPRVCEYDMGDLEHGCAGDGSPVTGVRCYLETPDPATTGWLAVEYAVESGGRWLADMRDTYDTGGSGDDFAGDGGAVTAFRARIVRA